MKRLIALTVVILLVVVFGGGCGNGPGSPGWTGKIKGEPPPIDLEGEEILVVDHPDNHNRRWQRHETSNPYNDAWQRVLDNIEQKWNCKIKLNIVPLDSMLTEALPEIMAGEKYCDIFCTTQWQFGHMLGADLMRDLNELSTNWENPWWNPNIRRIGTINGKTFAANGSFIFDAVDTWIIRFNFDVWNDLNLPDPYEMVENGEWTMDRLMDYSKRAMRDNDGNGIVDTPDDRWGIVAPDGDFARALYMSAGNQYFLEENGKMVMGCYDTRSLDFIARMRKFNREDKSVAPNFFRDMGEQRIPMQEQMFMDGRTLFYSCRLVADRLRNMEADWGVLPMPKYDEAQESYMNCVDHNATVMGITKTHPNPESLGKLLDAIGFYAMELEKIYWPDYEETYWRHEEDTRIIADYVCHAGRYDMALLLQNVDPVFRTPMSLVFDAMFGGLSDISSAVEARKEAVDFALDKYFADWQEEVNRENQ
ncbi:MAG: extracellular solute-binding protein [Oscillospiraceae bacterium]|nr:extracellular solute-binding protein [Oscillospiraceae bacterium]